MLARDKATSFYGGTYVRESYDGVDEVVAVRLSRFLQTLLGDDLGVPNFDTEQIKMRTQLLEDMDHAWINFTHFVKLSVPINEVTPSMLREAWSSGYAFQCASNQPVIDGFLVIYCGDLNGSFDPTNLSVVPWRTKVTCSISGITLAHQLTAPFLLENSSAP
jgi:hypothetical protein